jgi:hypothetical protein
MDTENPNTSNTTQIEFIYCRKDGFWDSNLYNSKLQRPMPELLCGVVTENDFESFCDNVDLVLERYSESQTVFVDRTHQMLWIYVTYALAIVLCVIVLPHNILHLPVFEVFIYLSPVPFFAWIIITCKHDCCEHSFRNQIHMECLELTNRTDNATFLLVMHVIEHDFSEYINKEFSHISVLISGVNDQLKHNVTDDDATVCTLENVSQ